MNSPYPLLLLLLPFSILSSTLLTATPTSPSPSFQGLRARLTHLNSGDHHRHTAPPRSLRAPLHQGNREFLIDLAIGTPSRPFRAILDTGSDLIWTQCKPCHHCYPQSTPVFDPSSSSTFSALPCSSAHCHNKPCNGSHCKYAYGYGGQSDSKGVLASETFKFDSTAVQGITFGCGHTNHGTKVLYQASGLVGLGRGDLSLVSQLGFTKFAYCLARTQDIVHVTSHSHSTLLLGSLASFEGISEDATVKSTPIVKNRNHTTFYYISLLGITVGDSLLNISRSKLNIARDGSGGVVVDSGSSITFLRTEVYKEVRKAFVSKVDLKVANGSKYGYDLCFEVGDGERVEMPKLVFHFQGADMDLPEENYIDGGPSVRRGLRCLAINHLPLELSIFGNFQQRGLLVLYDLEKEMLSFAPAQCDRL